MFCLQLSVKSDRYKVDSSSRLSLAASITMSELNDVARKIGITSPRVLRKAKEYQQLLDIRGNSGCLAALKMPGSCKTVACLELAANSCSQHLDRANLVRIAGVNKSQYTMSMKTIETMLDIEEVRTIRDISVQFGCTAVVSLAQDVLKRYEDRQRCKGDDLDFKTCLFQSAAVLAACRKQKVRVDRKRLKDMCGVKQTCLDALVADMEKLAEQIQGEKHTVVSGKRSSTLLDEVERKLQEDVPDKKRRNEDLDDDAQAKVDYEAWKKRILENAAKAKS